VRCVPAESGKWRLRVDNAVGVISVADLQIAVEPKIPRSHLLHLFERSGAIPRTEDQLTLVEPDEPLWKLVMSWFIASTELLMRRGLMRDYTPVRADIPLVRGKIHAAHTVLNVFRGRILADCDFEEFELDTPLNRLLLAAARVVAGSPVLDDLLRRRALHIVGRLDEIVGELQPDDLSASIERRTHHYADATTLARHVIRRSGRTLSHGVATSWSFLIPTPIMIEEGIRRIIQHALVPGMSVVKQGRQLEGSNLTVNPDLVFGSNLALGDVKYKISSGAWNRADLYEVVSFAAAFRTAHAILITFSPEHDPIPAPALKVGDIAVSELTWAANTAITPREAEDALISQVLTWMSDLRDHQVLSLGAQIPT